MPLGSAVRHTLYGSSLCATRGRGRSARRRTAQHRIHLPSGEAPDIVERADGPAVALGFAAQDKHALLGNFSPMIQPRMISNTGNFNLCDGSEVLK